jgi:acyl-CoA reductase-like NAD-dependent aldehyde dehydrogenase
MPAKDRSAILRRWPDLMLANVDDLGKLRTAEKAKEPYTAARDEVGSLVVLLAIARGTIEANWTSDCCR